MNIARLREATAADHSEVESTVPLLGEGLDLPGYRSILERMHGVVAAWEEYAEQTSPPWLSSHLQQRSRLALLEADLHALGGRIDSARAKIPELHDEAELMGAMYVMEGSRLGGQLIARHVERTLGIERGAGDAYFQGYGDRTGEMWKEFLALLRDHVSESSTERTIAGAKTMFHVFGDWMRTDRMQSDHVAGHGLDVSGEERGRHA